jgi:hypothetical protein
LLQRQCAFAQCAQDARKRVLDNSHNETIEQRHATRGAGPAKIRPPGKNLKNFVELVLPFFTIVRFNRGDSASDAPPGFFDRLLAEAAVFFMTVFGLPDVICVSSIGGEQLAQSGPVRNEVSYFPPSH